MLLKLLTLLLALTVIPAYNDELCHQAAKLRPGFISKYNFGLVFTNSKRYRKFVQNITADMYIRSGATPKTAEVVFRAGTINCSKTIPEKDCPEYYRQALSTEKFVIQCSRNDRVEMNYLLHKPYLKRMFNGTEFINLKWMLFIIDRGVINGLKENESEYNKVLTAVFEDIQAAGEVRHSFNYTNPDVIEIESVCEGFSTDRVISPFSFAVHSLVDREDFSVRELTGKFNMSSARLIVDVKFTFDGHLPAEENKQVFENRTIPFLLDSKADASLTRLLEPQVGFDAKWKLVVTNLSLDGQLNEPFEGDVILRNIGDPRFVVWKLVLPQVDSYRDESQISQPSLNPTSSNDVGLVSFSSAGFLLFDLLGDCRLSDLLPRSVLNTFKYWEMLDVEALKQLNDSNLDSFTTKVNPEFTFTFIWDFNDTCELEHIITRNDEEIKVVVELSKNCVVHSPDWKFRCEQLFRSTDQKLRGINLLYQHLNGTLTNASLSYVESVPSKYNDALFKVYGDKLDLQWFKTE